MEIENILLWVLRFAYPAVALLLWRWRWSFLWPWFMLYLMAVSFASWVYSPWLLRETLWSDVPAMGLKAIATWEVLSRVFQEEPPKSRRMLKWLLLAAGIVGVAVTLGLRYGPDPQAWIAYKVVRTAMNGALFMGMLTGYFYGRFFGAIGPKYAWSHATVWLVYLWLYVAFGLVVPEERWAWVMAVALFRGWSLVCLVWWVVIAARSAPYRAHKAHKAYSRGHRRICQGDLPGNRYLSLDPGASEPHSREIVAGPRDRRGA
jgi:hypothetical protein